MISSYVGENKTFERQFLDGKLEVELSPQGTLAERMRAGGAGIPAFYTPTGYGTMVAEGKETREFDGTHVRARARAARPTSRIVKAWKGDRFGQPRLPEDGAQLQPDDARPPASVTIAEVEELVEPGELDPDQVHTPGIYVQRIFQGANYEKPIEQRTVRKRSA